MDAHPKTQEVYTKHPYTICLFIALKGMKHKKSLGKRQSLYHILHSLKRPLKGKLYLQSKCIAARLY